MEPSDHSAKPADSNSLECSLEHAIAAHSNAQEIIQFLDTKSAAVISLATLTTPIPIAALSWALSDRESATANLASFWSEYSGCLQSAAVCLLLALVLGAITIGLALASLLARSGDGASTLLFPFYAHHEAADAARLGEQLERGIDLAFRLSEYRRQILTLGVIIHRKLFWHRWSMWLFGSQMLALMAALAFLLIGFLHCGTGS